MSSAENNAPDIFNTKSLSLLDCCTVRVQYFPYKTNHTTHSIASSAILVQQLNFCEYRSTKGRLSMHTKRKIKKHETRILINRRKINPERKYNTENKSHLN